MAASEGIRNGGRPKAGKVVRETPDAFLLEADGLRLFPVAAVALSLLTPALLLFLAPFNPDEVEYFRASRWVASGLVPFRDFWEHHLPLHWVLLAPFAPLTRPATVESLLVLRLAQLPLLALTVYLALRMLVRVGVSRAARLFGLSLFFLAIHRSVVEIRIDVTMNLFLLAGLLVLTAGGDTRARRPELPFLGGVLLGLACLASQRAIPMALVAAAASSIPELTSGTPFSLRTLARRPLLTAAGLATTAIVALVVAWSLGALPALWEDCFQQNFLYERLSEQDARGPSALDWARRFLLRPGAVALVALGIAGGVLGLRNARTRALTAVAAILAVAQIAFLATIRSPFPYQFQTLFWLLALLAAMALDAVMRIGRRAAMGAAAAVAILAAVGMLHAVAAVRWPVLAETLAHQDHVLRTVERLSPAGSVVLEGCGFAVNRRPAMKTWFLPSLARSLMAAGFIDSPKVADLESRRIALVVADSRLLETVRGDERLGPFVARSFFPVERFVWAPAPNARLRPGERTEWTVMTAGPHRVVELPLQALDAWFESPWSFPFQRPTTSAAFRVDVTRLRSPDPLAVSLFEDGIALEPGPGGLVVLRAGARLVAQNVSGSTRAVLVLPAKLRVVLDAPFPSTYIEPNLEF
jgi:hypothetical protein